MADDRPGKHTGGAAAAVSDRARARQRAGTSAGLERRRQEAAVDTFRDAAALLRALRTHEADHPRVSGFVDRLCESIEAYFGIADELSVTLQARTLLADEGVVFEVDRVGENPWFPLFAAGVRRLVLRRGITRAELSELLGTVRALLDQTNDDNEHDSVTVLWERNFEHVGFTVIDGFAAGPGADADGARVERLQAMLERDARRDLNGAELVGDAYASGALARRGQSDRITAADLELLRARNLSVLSRLPDSARSVSYRLLEVDARDRAQLVADCHQDRTFIGRYFGALLLALARRADGADGQHVLARLQELCLELIGMQELRKAHQMLVHLAHAVPNSPDINDFLISDGAVRHIVSLMADNPRTHIEEDGVALLAALSPDRARAVVGAVTHVDDAPLRRRLLELASRWGDAAAVAAGDAVREAKDEVVPELIGFIRHIGGDDSVATLDELRREPSGKHRVRTRPARSTDLPAFRGTPLQNVELPARPATTYLHKPGRARRESVGPVPTRDTADIDALVAGYVADTSEPDRGE